MKRRIHGLIATACLLPLAVAGCGAKAEKSAEGSESKPVRPISITVADLERRTVERAVEVVGTLKGWDEVTVGAKKGGRVLKVLHDFGDTVAPGEPLVELETIDANLGLQQAETKYLSDLTRLGVTRKQAEAYLAKFGMGEKILTAEDVDHRIRDIPAVVQAKVALERAQLNLGRQRNLSLRNAGTAQDLSNAENDADAAKAAFDNALVTARATLASAFSSKVALDVAQQALNDMIVRAPVPSKLPKDVESAGTPVAYAIVKRPVHEGQMVKEGDALFDLVIQNPLRLWVNVPEKYTPDIQLGQAVKVRIGSRPGDDFPGRVARINPSVDPINRTFQVEALVPNAKGLLRPGGFAKASILTKSDAGAAVVPMESVVKFAGVTKIFVIENGVARAIPVKTRLEGKDWIEITGDLPSRGTVVTSGQTMLADGAPVEIRKPAKADAKSGIGD